MTDFQAAAGEYLALRRALGFKLIQAERILRSFTSYLHEQGASGITTRIAVEWAVLPGRASRWWWQQRLSVVRGFARYLQAFDPNTEIPPPGLIYSPAPRITPYRFSDADIAVLMTAAGKLNPPLRAATYQTLIGLASVTGMRVGEMIALDEGDISLGDRVIVVRNAKFGNYAEGAVMPSPVTGLAVGGNSAQD